jgi:hypothetical protein
MMNNNSKKSKTENYDDHPLQIWQFYQQRISLLNLSYLKELQRKQAQVPAYLVDCDKNPHFTERIFVTISKVSIEQYYPTYFSFWKTGIPRPVPLPKSLENKSVLMPFLTIVTDKGPRPNMRMWWNNNDDNDELLMQSDMLLIGKSMHFEMTIECLLCPDVLHILQDVLPCDVRVHSLIGEFYA